MRLDRLIARRDRAQEAAREILGDHEEAPSRVIELQESFERLRGLPVDVAEYYREALQALQVGCYRAAMVFAWAGFIYTLAAKLVQGYQAELAADYSKWRFATTEELFDSAAEFQVLEAAKKCGLIKNQDMLIYKGWLSTRNQCAHPTLFTPTRNSSLGYVDGVLTEVAKFI